MISPLSKRITKKKKNQSTSKQTKRKMKSSCFTVEEDKFVIIKNRDTVFTNLKHFEEEFLASLNNGHN